MFTLLQIAARNLARNRKRTLLLGGAIAIVTVLGPGLINALLAIGIVSIPRFARLIRSTVLSVKELDYVTASRAIGVPSMRILFDDEIKKSL